MIFPIANIVNFLSKRIFEDREQHPTRGADSRLSFDRESGTNTGLVGRVVVARIAIAADRAEGRRGTNIAEPIPLPIRDHVGPKCK